MRFTVSSALPTAPSAQLTFLALGQAPAKAQPLSVSPQQARSRDATLMRVGCFTVFCALRTVQSLPSTSRVQAQVLVKAPAPPTSTHRRRSRDATLIRIM